MNSKNFIKLWLPVILWAGVIYFFSSLQTNNLDAPFSLSDFIIKKNAHVFEFALLAVLFFRALYQSFKNKVFIKNAWLTFGFGILYAISDEFHQRFIFGRTSRLRDVVIDGVGILLALLFLKILMKYKDKYKRIYHFIFGK
ncbi:VanZ family protein [Candidatus Beckwithbacteria bacterium]|nr:VanZ family protein [Candidatus Beckwithbacteria bacterium]